MIIDDHRYVAHFYFHEYLRYWFGEIRFLSYKTFVLYSNTIHTYLSVHDVVITIVNFLSGILIK